MRIAFAGRFSHPITGAESVPINLLRELVTLDTANEYTLFVGRDAVDAIGFRADNFVLQVYNSFGKDLYGTLSGTRWYYLSGFGPLVSMSCLFHTTAYR